MNGRVLFAVAIVLSLALAAGCGYVFCTAYPLPAGALAAIYIGGIALSVPICDLLHEGAHFAVGNALRMGVKWCRYVPFAPSSVTVDPRSCGHMRLRMAITTSAGVTVNALFVALGIAALCGALPAWLCIPAPYSAYLALLNGIPDDRSARNDGEVVRGLIVLDDASRVMLALLNVQARLNTGERLADIGGEELFDLPQLPEDDVLFIMLTRLRYEYLAAAGREEEALKYLKRFNELRACLPEGYDFSDDNK